MFLIFLQLPTVSAVDDHRHKAHRPERSGAALPNTEGLFLICAWYELCIFLIFKIGSMFWTLMSETVALGVFNV